MQDCMFGVAAVNINMMASFVGLEVDQEFAEAKGKNLRCALAIVNSVRQQTYWTSIAGN